MSFDSYQFVVFLIVVVGAYWFLSHKWQNWLLLVASYFFYGCWDWRFLSLIIVSTIVDFVAGKAIHDSDDGVRKKRWLILSCVVNLGLLGFFKYYGFFADEFRGALELRGLTDGVTYRVTDYLHGRRFPDVTADGDRATMDAEFESYLLLKVTRAN